MVILETKHLIVRNVKADDFDALNELSHLSKEDLSKAVDDDFDSEGEKLFAIDKSDNLIGLLSINFNKPYVIFNYEFTSKEDTRINAQELLTTLVKYLHNLYKHREILISANKFDYQKRSLLENLSFKRKSLDSDSNIYTYSLFTFNPNK